MTRPIGTTETHRVTVGIALEAMVEFGEASIRHRGDAMWLNFPMGMTCSMRDFREHVERIDNDQHCVWACVGEGPAEVYCMDFLAHDTMVLRRPE